MSKDVRRSIFAYNHADWYVDSVMLRARLIAGVPADLVGSLTGLTEGRFPVAARARYADDLQEAEADQARQARPERRQRDRVQGRPPLDRDLRPEGRPRRRDQRRRDQEDRPQPEARPLHRPPGRVRQPLHLLRPRHHRQVLPRAQGRRDGPQDLRARRSRPTTTTTIEAHRARLGRAPARRGRLRHASSADKTADADARRLDPGQGAPVRPPGHAAAPARPAGSSSCSTPRRARRAASRPTRTTSRARSAPTPRTSACAA